jgi:hypothetical protein
MVMLIMAGGNYRIESCEPKQSQVKTKGKNALCGLPNIPPTCPQDKNRDLAEEMPKVCIRLEEPHLCEENATPIHKHRLNLGPCD